jgi:hypothetical protein
MSKVYAIPTQDRFLLSRDQAAEYLNISPVTFDGMVLDGRMPPARMINTRKLWKRAAIEKACDNLPIFGQDDAVSPYSGLVA